MKRNENWERLLIQGIRDSYLKKFVWGETDCVKWSFELVNSFLEEGKITPPVKWSNKEEALKLLAEKSLYDRMCDLLGEPQILSRTNRGDLVYFNSTSTGETIGVSAGDKVVFISSKGGIVAKDLLECTASWRIN